MSSFARYHKIGSRLADIAHKSAVVVMATGCALGSVNLALGFHEKYTDLKEKKRLATEQRLQKEQEAFIAGQAQELQVDDASQ